MTPTQRGPGDPPKCPKGPQVGVALGDTDVRTGGGDRAIPRVPGAVVTWEGTQELGGPKRMGGGP